MMVIIITMEILYKYIADSKVEEITKKSEEV